MLREFKAIRQVPRDEPRRWFEGELLELVVWYARPGGIITGFQILYTTAAGGSRALTWKADGGFAHSHVDEGDDTPLKNCSPVLVPDGAVPWSRLIAMFSEQSPSIEQPLRELVLSHLERAASAQSDPKF